MKRVIELVNGGATSALNLNLKRWFTELSVAWVLDLPDDVVSALEPLLQICRVGSRPFVAAVCSAVSTKPSL